MGAGADALRACRGKVGSGLLTECALNFVYFLRHACSGFEDGYDDIS